MEHVVFFPGPDGAPAFRRFASLDEAVRFVEHLRNAEGVAEVSVHALSEVPLAFRPYYRVEVPVPAAHESTAVFVEEAPEPVAAAEEPVAAAEEPVAEPVEPVAPVVDEVPAEVPAAEVTAADIPAPAGEPYPAVGFFAH